MQQRYALRVSLLENCQYRCPYCLPGSVKRFTQKPSWLSVDEYARLASAFSDLAITKLRFTGGEPLLRQDLADIVAAFRKSMPLTTLSLTTNAQYLPERFDELRKAGISRINVHIDSLDAAKYKRIMGNGDLAAILGALPAFKAALDELKINVVLQKGINDDELSDFITYSEQTGIEVRFIEQMNTGSAPEHVKNTFLSGQDAILLIRKHHEVRHLGRRHLSDPADCYAIGAVTFGLIASDTQPFCSACNRLRLDAQGGLRGCLYQGEGLALGAMMRNGASEPQLREALMGAVQSKRSFHPVVGVASQRPFSMAEIGG